MMAPFRLFLSGLMIFHFSALVSQQKNDLTQMDYEYLESKIMEFKGEKAVYVYLRAYLSKAKKEENLDEIMNGYHNYIYEAEQSQKLIYADSLLYTAELTHDHEQIGSALLTKGIVYYSGKDHNKALDCYLAADRMIAVTDNDYLKYKTQYNIAQVKYYLGFYNEAVSILLMCSEYFKGDNSRAYLNCLHSLSLAYTRLGNLEESEEVNVLARKESVRLKDFSMTAYLDHAQGINDYFRKSYQQAVIKIKKSLPELEKQNDFGNLSVGYFYLASCYWDTGQKKLALPYLLMVDDIFTDKKYLRPDLRRNYEMLIDYYKNKGELQEELKFNNKLILADKILYEKYSYLSSRIFKEYDTSRLISSNRQIRQELNNEKSIKKALLAFSLILVPVLGFLAYRNLQLRRYKKSFELYISKGSSTEIRTASKAQRPNITDALEQKLLGKLEKFESSLGYLKKDLKVEKLAVSFGTNYKYLSQVINYHKGMSYPDYISSLRIDYIVKRLEEDPKLRKYNFGIIAEEAGFGTAQQFTDVFRKKMGMSFGFFLNKL
jgi:AraC-like DNA-binding protein